MTTMTLHITFRLALLYSFISATQYIICSDHTPYTYVHNLALDFHYTNVMHYRSRSNIVTRLTAGSTMHKPHSSIKQTNSSIINACHHSLYHHKLDAMPKPRVNSGTAMTPVGASPTKVGHRTCQCTKLHQCRTFQTKHCQCANISKTQHHTPAKIAHDLNNAVMLTRVQSSNQVSTNLHFTKSYLVTSNPVYISRYNPSKPVLTSTQQHWEGSNNRQRSVPRKSKRKTWNHKRAKNRQDLEDAEDKQMARANHEHQ